MIGELEVGRLYNLTQNTILWKQLNNNNIRTFEPTSVSSGSILMITEIKKHNISYLPNLCHCVILFDNKIFEGTLHIQEVELLT